MVVLTVVWVSVCMCIGVWSTTSKEGDSEVPMISGEGESWPTSEDEYITDNRGEHTLLEKLDLVNSHVSNLVYAFNGTTMFKNDLKTLANMAEEMKNIHDEITELKYSDFDMKVKFNLTDSDIKKAKTIYFDTLHKMVKLSELLKSFE